MADDDCFYSFSTSTDHLRVGKWNRSGRLDGFSRHTLCQDRALHAAIARREVARGESLRPLGPSGLEVKTKGKWIPIGKQDATQLGLTCDAVAVEYQITDMVKLPSMEKISEGEATVLRDTMFIVPSPKEGVGFLFKSDLVELFKGVNPKIHEISIPGTHDTFTYNLSKVTGLWGKTQVFDLEQQLDAGVRYFDFRLGGMNVSNLGFYHGFLCCEITLPKALDKQHAK